MHRPPVFREERPDVVVELVERAGYGHLVVAGPDGLASTPLPVLVDPPATDVPGIGRLRGHLARPNAVWRAAPCPAMVIVPLVDAYVSPSWYPSKVEHGKVVPTWNYEVVHVHGELVAHDDAEWVERMVRDLTDRHEGHRAAPWSVDDAPAPFLTAMLGAIVGVELVATRVEAKRKLSQNRPADDVDGAIAGLDAESTPRASGVAAAMRDVRG